MNRTNRVKRPHNESTPPPRPKSSRRVTRRTASLGPITPETVEKKHFPDARGEYTVQVHEGRTLGPGDVPGLVRRFTKLCNRPGSVHSIEGSYTAGVLNNARHHVNSTFVIAAVHSQRAYTAALAHCTLHSGLPGIAPRKVVFIDLVCSDANRRGIGAVLMGELESYARDTLGAQALVLQSVLNPATQHAYYSKGFERGVGNRSAATLNRAREAFRVLNTLGNAKLNTLLGCATGECRKRLAAHLNSVQKNMPGVRPKQAWKNSLRGEYYPAYNTLYKGGDAFVMTKRIAPPNSWLGAVWPQRNGGVVSWGRGNGHATFRDPKARVLALYKRAASGRLERQ